MTPDPSTLLTGDVLHCDGGIDPFSLLTRLVTGPKTIAPVRRMFDHTIPTHTALVCTLAGQHLAAEMTPRGVAVNSPQAYARIGRPRPRRLVAVYRPFLSAPDRERIDTQCAADIRRGIEYAFRDLPRFVCERIRADRRRMYCSEYVYQRLRPYCPDMPAGFSDMVSPFDLMRYQASSDRHRPVWPPVRRNGIL